MPELTLSPSQGSKNSATGNMQPDEGTDIVVLQVNMYFVCHQQVTANVCEIFTDKKENSEWSSCKVIDD